MDEVTVYLLGALLFSVIAVIMMKIDFMLGLFGVGMIGGYLFGFMLCHVQKSGSDKELT